MPHVGIITAWNYAWSVLTACFVLGIAMYLLDRKLGVKLYRFGYDFFHKNPMPGDVERGFLYNQSSNRGVTVAVFLSTVYSLYMVWELGFSLNFIAELIVWLLMPPALVGGFWTGRWVYKLLLRRSVYLDNLDEFGEQVENIASVSEYHWMAGNFLKYAGPLTPKDLPVDAHELIALCAPRPVFISSGSLQVEGGWIDAKGMFLGAAGAGPVYKLLGKKDLGTKQFPTMETALTQGELAFRQHTGGHTAGPNWPTFLEWAGRYLKSPK